MRMGKHDLSDSIQATYDRYEINFLKMLQIKMNHSFKNPHSHNIPFFAYNSKIEYILDERLLIVY